MLNMDPLHRPLWRGRTNVDQITIAAIEYAESLRRQRGSEFVITQGSYQSSVAASAGTHDLGGVVDIRWTGDDHDIWCLRKAGFAAWHRTPEQSDWPHHIHAVLVDHPHLAPSAARQVEAYRAGRNGLASNGPDDGPRITPIPVFDWPPPEDDMFSEADSKRLERIEQKLDTSNRNQRERDYRIIRDIKASLDVLQAAAADDATVSQVRAVKRMVAELATAQESPDPS